MPINDCQHSFSELACEPGAEFAMAVEGEHRIVVTDLTNGPAR